MKTIDLGRIVKEADLPPLQIAQLLFPGNKYPKMAYDRIVKGEALLDSVQIVALAARLGLDINDLFDELGWKTIYSKSVYNFTKGDYLAVFNVDTGQSVLIYKGGIIIDEILHSVAIPLVDYLNYLETNISKFQKDE